MRVPGRADNGHHQPVFPCVATHEVAQMGDPKYVAVPDVRFTPIPGPRSAARQDPRYARAYRAERKAGGPPRYTPAEPVTEHVRQLLAAGALGARIAAEAGVSPSQVSALAAGARRFVQRPVADAVLAVPLQAVLCGDLTEVVRRHLAGLLAQRLTLAGIARAAQVHPQTVRDAVAGRRRVAPRTAAALLRVSFAAVATADADGQALVPAVGARRQVEALQAMGWRRADIAQAAGLPLTVLPLRGQDQIQVRASRAIRDAYERLGIRPGPSTVTAERASCLGYAPPLAWDSVAIDDPTETPQGLPAPGRRLRRRADVVEDAGDLAAAGEILLAAAARMGMRPQVLERTLLRAGRSDLVSALKRTDRAA